jgi:hypothetical protein
VDTQKRLIRFAALALVVASLGGCTTLCGGFKPVTLGPNDKVGANTARGILSNNEYGRAQCGWNYTQ